MGKLPKGTTQEQWDRYHFDMKAHEEFYASIRPKTEDFPDYDSWNKALSKWLFNKACDAPNKPGYYRANND